MNPLTPAQVRTIQTWNEQRDALIREIGNYTIERDELRKSTKEEGLALADLHQSIAEANGRIAEINALEERMRGSIATDVAELEVRKSRLEGECVLLADRLDNGGKIYEILTIATRELQGAHDVMKDQAAIVNRVVGEVIQTSQLHTSDMKTIMTEIKTTADEVIKKGNENIAQTGIVIEKLPKFIFDMQKPIPVRRTYPVGHPRYEEPQN